MKTRAASTALALSLTALGAVVTPARTADAAITGDAAVSRLADLCREDGRSLADKARFVFAAGPERAGAVEALGKALGAHVERLDLTTMADANQYIGETEKNLDRLLRPEPRTPAVLFFDEADALFGARTPTLDGLAERLGKIAANRVVVIGLKARPVVGRLGRRALAALPGPATAPWPAVCGPRD